MTSPVPKTPQQLLDALHGMGIDVTTTDHAAVMTVEQSQALRGSISGHHAKNLFFKDKKQQLWLVVAEEDRTIDIKSLRKRIGAANLSFAKSEVLIEVLGVQPGSVTPFAVINDTAGRVRVVLDRTLAEAPLTNFHPLTNTKSTSLSGAALLFFLQNVDHPPLIIDFDSPLESP